MQYRYVNLVAKTAVSLPRNTLSEDEEFCLETITVTECAQTTNNCVDIIRGPQRVAARRCRTGCC